MTEIDSAVDPFVEAEIKEHQAALIRDMVIVCVMLTLVGTASLIINTARGLVGWLTVGRVEVTENAKSKNVGKQRQMTRLKAL
jgi:hypothetical protein